MKYLIAFLFCAQAYAEAPIKVKVRFDFGGIETRTEYPVYGSRFQRYVRYIDGQEGPIRIEFMEVRNNEKTPTPMAFAEASAEILPGPGGKILFKLSSPVAYEYIRVNETTGVETLVKGEVKTALASISQENAEGFNRIVLGAPQTGYIAKKKMAMVLEMVKAAMAGQMAFNP